MTVGNEYEFRVIALNKGGESEISPVSNTILAKVRFIKPKINRDVFPADKTALADQIMRIEAEIVAEPKPTVSWFFPDGKSVTESGKGTVEFEDGVATLTVKDIKRSDAGNFHIVVKIRSVSTKWNSVWMFCLRQRFPKDFWKFLMSNQPVAS